MGRLLGTLFVSSLAVVACGGRDEPPEKTSAAAVPVTTPAVATPEPTTPPPPSRSWQAPEALPGGQAFDAALRAELSSALATKPADYKPRTRHLGPDGAPLYTNRLIRESSPYLLQHAHNPVDWRPWGDEAFEEARALKRPVLLSVGYSTCHWCHVMEEESFEDVEIATYINEHYVPIKVDREERPDVDTAYMEVLQLLTGGGGWPMTVILTPQRQPLFAGTYFPPRDGDRGVGVGFLSVLAQINERYIAEGAAMASEAAVTTRRLQALSAPTPPGDLPDAKVISAAVADFSAAFDTVFGGFGGAPKFPRPMTIELLLRYHRRTGDADALHMAVYTLERMAAGGIHDHVGGGFHRYSTDARWLVPHFEKMLYDNAELAIAYLEGFQVTRHAELSEVAADILDYVAREMTDASGGFYSATDADSIGAEGEVEEGAYFTWTPAEIREVLDGKDAELVLEAYGVTEAGNFGEGRSVLQARTSLDTVGVKLGLSEADARRRLAKARAVLRTTRSKRSAPATDTKIIAGWNGLMISAFARGALVLGNAGYESRARNAAELVATRLVGQDGKLSRVWKDGAARHAAVLDDYAFVIAGLLDLFEVNSDPRWLDLAVVLQKRLDSDFADERGGYYLTAHDAEKLLLRSKPDSDGALPSGNAIALLNLMRLSELTGNEQYRSAATKGLRGFGRAARLRPTSMPKMLVALDYYLDTPKEIVLVSPSEDAKLSPLVAALAGVFVPNRVMVSVHVGAQAKAIGERVPLAVGKPPLDDAPTAYLCENHVCKKPTNDGAELAKQAAVAAPYPGTDR